MKHKEKSELSELEDYRKTAESIETFLEENPGLPPEEQISLIRQLGGILASFREYGKLIRILRRYEKRFPPDSRERLYIRTVQSYYYGELGDFKKTIEIGEEILPKLDRAGDERTLGLLLRNLGIAYTNFGEIDKAQEMLEGALYMFRKISDYNQIISALTHLSMIYLIRSKWDIALDYRKKALKIAKRHKIDEWIPHAVLNIGQILVLLGKWNWAEKLYSIGRKYNIPHITNIQLLFIPVDISIFRREFKKASKLLSKAQAEAKRERATLDLVWIYALRGIILHEKGDFKGALRDYHKAHRIIEKIAPEGIYSLQVKRLIAESYAAEGKIEKARPYLEKALLLSQNLKNKFNEALTHRIRARISVIQNETDSAIYYYERSIELLEEIAELYERGRTLLEYGKFLSNQGNYFQALRQLQKAEDLLKKLPSEYWIATTHLAMAENYCRTNDYDLALKYLEMSRKVFERLKEKESLIEVQKLRNKIENGMLEYALLRANEFTIPNENIDGMLSHLREKTGSRSLILLSRENGSFEVLKDIGATPGLKEFVKQFVNERNLRKPLLSTGMINQKEFAFLKKHRIGSFLFLPFSQSDDSMVLYLDKKEPFKQDEMIFTVRFTRALAAKLSELKQRELKEQNLQLIRELRKREFPNIITKNSRMLDILDLVDKIKDDTTPVLIEGETGTGKELIARAIHYRSKRSSKPFVPVDCGALPDGLAESLLFGHRKGAFTGALQDSPGFFEEAHKGTLFLDEISNLSPKVQAKLLRVLQDGTIRRLGEHRSRKVDVRIIAASNVDLEEAVRKGDFRKDLFYRLKGIRIKLPPLRERKEDIPLLVQYFVSKYSREKGKKVRKITKEAINALMAHDWDGNVRELEREIERAIVLMEDGNITPVLFSFIQTKNQKTQLTIDEVLEALKKNNWVIRKTARYLGISESTLRKRLKSNGIHLTAGAQRNV